MSLSHLSYYFLAHRFFQCDNSWVSPVSVIRVGKKKEQGSRPLKIIMASVQNKDNIMRNLGKLKDAPENLRKISVTDDYTQEEQESIRQKVAEAKKMTETKGEGKYVWRVRGTPKNGLILRRFNLAPTVTEATETASNQGTINEAADPASC